MTKQPLYDAIAQEYHEMVEADFSSQSVLGLAVGSLLNQLGDVQGKGICDVACGDGKLAHFLAEKGASVTAIDLSGELLKIAQKNYPDVTFIQDDAQHLSNLESDTFDIVTCNFALMDIPDLTATYQAVKRILKTDGRFVFTITHPCFQSPHATNFKDESGNFEARYVVQYATEGHWKSTYSKGIRGQVGAHHRTISTYLMELVQYNYQILAVSEPTLPPETYETAYHQSIAEIPPVMLIDTIIT